MLYMARSVLIITTLVEIQEQTSLRTYNSRHSITETHGAKIFLWAVLFKQQLWTLTLYIVVKLIPIITPHKF